jgi:hypothetical protein
VSVLEHFNLSRADEDGFEGGVDFGRPDSGGIDIKPPLDFPRSGYACYGCGGVESEACCQHVRRGLVIYVEAPARTSSPATPTSTERPRRRLFGRRRAR